MKTITNIFKLAAVASVLAASFAAHADTTTVPVTGQITSPITSTLVNGLAFGAFSRAAGSLTIDPSAGGAASSTGAMVSFGGQKAGHLSVTGQSGLLFNVTVPTAATGIYGSGTAMNAVLNLNSITTNLPGNQGTFGATASDIYIGGTITIGDASAALPGPYSGSFPVTVAYN